MYDACNINETEGGEQRGGAIKVILWGWQATKWRTIFLGGVNPTRHHDISLHSTKGYLRHKTKVKVKNKFIQTSPPLIKNTKETRIC